jgi:ElaB/YqjD/DUF883 family membrane-anchored ribosome-binding protein
METHFPFTESSDLAARSAQLQSDLKLVVRDIEELVKSAAGHLNEKTAGQINAVLSRAKALAQRCEQCAAAGLRQADQTIREHPYESAGIAFALGALIGVLVNRR